MRGGKVAKGNEGRGGNKSQAPRELANGRVMCLIGYAKNQKHFHRKENAMLFWMDKRNYYSNPTTFY